jgi:hypothetical protein
MVFRSQKSMDASPTAETREWHLAELRRAFIALAPSRTRRVPAHVAVPFSVSRGLYRMSGSGKHLSAVVERRHICRAVRWKHVPPVHERRWMAKEVVDSNGVGAMGRSEFHRALQGRLNDHHGSRSSLWSEHVGRLAITYREQKSPFPIQIPCSL